jgi:hypothetical protein
MRVQRGLIGIKSSQQTTDRSLKPEAFKISDATVTGQFRLVAKQLTQATGQ